MYYIFRNNYKYSKCDKYKMIYLCVVQLCLLQIVWEFLKIFVQLSFRMRIIWFDINLIQGLKLRLEQRI